MVVDAESHGILYTQQPVTAMSHRVTISRELEGGERVNMVLCSSTNVQPEIDQGFIIADIKRDQIGEGVSYCSLGFDLRSSKPVATCRDSESRLTRLGLQRYCVSGCSVCELAQTDLGYRDFVSVAPGNPFRLFLSHRLMLWTSSESQTLQIDKQWTMTLRFGIII